MRWDDSVTLQQQMMTEAGPVILISQFKVNLSGMMAVAYWQFHFPSGNWPVQNQGMPAVLFCFIFLYMAARGAGEWSLDELMRRKRGSVANGK